MSASATDFSCSDETYDVGQETYELSEATVEQRLSAELDSAQSELAAAEVALLEATERAAKASERAKRLEAAVAALNGVADVPIDKGRDLADSDTAVEPLPPKKPKPDNPLAHVKCAGCGSYGTMYEGIQQAPSGAVVRLMTCNSCGNQVL